METGPAAERERETVFEWKEGSRSSLSQATCPPCRANTYSCACLMPVSSKRQLYIRSSRVVCMYVRTGSHCRAMNERDRSRAGGRKGGNERETDRGTGHGVRARRKGESGQTERCRVYIASALSTYMRWREWALARTL